MTDASFRPELLEYLDSRFMLSVPETNLQSLDTFVEHRLKERGEDFGTYLAALDMNRAERDLVIDASTIRETYFFRDASQFALVVGHILPFFRQVTGRNPTIWSAACSTGEEALSLALVLADQAGGVSEIAGCVWASDINPVSLAKFSGGVYRSGSLREDGAAWHPLLDQYCRRVGEELHLERNLIEAVTKLNLNLMVDDYNAIPGPVDLIFLRNMMIYLPFEKRRSVYRKIASKLSDDGVLILGKAELPFFEDSQVQLTEKDGCFFLARKGARILGWSQGGAPHG